jgi:hypothetical protein
LVVEVGHPERARAVRDRLGPRADVRHGVDHAVRARIDHSEGVRLTDLRTGGIALPEREDRDGDRGRDDADQGRAGVQPAPLTPELDIERAQLPEVARDAVDHELVHVLRVLEVLEPALAKVADRDPGRQVLLGQLPGGRGEEHLAAMAGRSDPGRAVHAYPDVAVLSHFGLARVEAHAHLDLRPLGPGVRKQVALGVDRSGDGVVGRRERGEEGVALRVHDPSAVGGESRAQRVRVRA